MRQRPAEINLRLGDLAVLHGEDFGVSEAIAASPSSFIGDEDLIAGCKQMNERELLDVLTGRPAVVHVARTIEPVIERTGEAEIVGKQRLDPCAVALYVGFEDAACDGNIVLMLRQGSNSRTATG